MRWCEGVSKLVVVSVVAAALRVPVTVGWCGIRWLRWQGGDECHAYAIEVQQGWWE